MRLAKFTLGPDHHGLLYHKKGGAWVTYLMALVANQRIGCAGSGQAIEELKDFTTGVQPADDATLVVMRVKDEDT